MSNEQVQENGVAVSPEQAADAAAIAAMVEQEAGKIPANDPAAENSDAVPSVQPEEALAGLLTVVSMAAGIVGMQRTAAVWNEGACKAVAAAAVPVLVKYPWGQRFIGFLQTGAGVEEVALVMVAGPLVVATAAAVKADLADKAKPEPEPEAGPAKLVPVSPAGNAAMMGLGRENG